MKGITGKMLISNRYLVKHLVAGPVATISWVVDCMNITCAEDRDVPDRGR